MLLESDATTSSASIWLFHDMFPTRCSLFYSFLFCTVWAINTCKHGLILSLRSCITSNKSPVKRVKAMLPIGKPGHDFVYIEYDIKIKRIEQAPRKIYFYKRADMVTIWRDLGIRFFQQTMSTCRPMTCGSASSPSSLRLWKDLYHLKWPRPNNVYHGLITRSSAWSGNAISYTFVLESLAAQTLRIITNDSEHMISEGD